MIETRCSLPPSTVTCPLESPFPAFLPSSTARLFSFTLTIMSTDDDIYGDADDSYATFAVPVSVFLSRLAASTADRNTFYPVDQDPNDVLCPLTILPWAVWGKDARWMHGKVGEHSICNSRLLVVEKCGDGQNAPVIYDYDSIPALLEDFHALSSSTKEVSYTIPEPTAYAEDILFETRVLASAPCRRVATELSLQAPEKAEIYEDGIIVYGPETRYVWLT